VTEDDETGGTAGTQSAGRCDVRDTERRWAGSGDRGSRRGAQRRRVRLDKFLMEFMLACKERGKNYELSSI